MNRKQTAAAIGVLLLAVLAGAFIGKAQGPSLPPGQYDLEAGQYIFNVPDLALTDTPLPPTDTPIPPSPTPSGPIDPYIGAPLCVTHDPIVWHGLWNYEQGCHYDHEHGEGALSPEAIALFGDYRVHTGQGVSYPWETPNENALKHEGYKVDFMDLAGYPCNPGIRDLGISAYMVERHAMSTGVGLLARDHSFFLILQLCDPDTGVEGLLMTGGQHDYGQAVAGYQGTLVNLSNQPQPPYITSVAPYRAHPCYNDTGGAVSGCSPIINDDQFRQLIWGSDKSPAAGAEDLEPHGISSLSFRTSDASQWVLASTISELDAADFIWVCDDGFGNFDPTGCKHNGSNGRAYQFIGEVRAEWDQDGDGIADFDGFTNIRGNINEACTETGPNCIPLKVIGAPVGRFMFNLNQSHPDFSDPVSLTALGDRDIYFCNGIPCGPQDPDAEPSGWIGPKN